MDTKHRRFGFWSFTQIKDLGYDLLCYYETNQTLIFKDSKGHSLFRSVLLNLNNMKSNFSLYSLNKKQLKVAEVIV